MAQAIVALLESLWREQRGHLLVHLHSQHITHQALIRFTPGPACLTCTVDLPAQHLAMTELMLNSNAAARHAKQDVIRSRLELRHSRRQQHTWSINMVTADNRPLTMAGFDNVESRISEPFSSFQPHA